MKRSVRAWLVCCLLVPASVAQARKSNEEQMLKLDPATRLEQRCDARGMGLVGREHPAMRPDELVAYAFGDPHVSGNLIEAPGAAIRVNGAWFHLSYVCETTDDRLNIKSFRYTLGNQVPREQWDAHYLVPK
jgi:hypothetical protein